MHKSKRKELKVIRLDTIRSKFINNVVILPSAEAEKMILKHPECSFEEFAFTGECYLDKWYYVAGNGPVHEQATQIILLEK